MWMGAPYLSRGVFSRDLQKPCSWTRGPCRPALMALVFDSWAYRGKQESFIYAVLNQTQLSVLQTHLQALGAVISWPEVQYKCKWQLVVTYITRLTTADGRTDGPGSSSPVVCLAAHCWGRSGLGQPAERDCSTAGSAVMWLVSLSPLES